MRRAVIDLCSSRPLWRVPADAVSAVRRAFGRGWQVVDVRAPSVSDGDGAAPSAEAVRAARGAEVYMGWGVPAAVAAAAADTLCWAHTAAGGVGGSLTPPLVASGAVLTNSRAVHAEPMADWALAAIAYCARGFHWAVAAQREGRWAKNDFTDGTVPLVELQDLRVGIVGLGGIGRAIARRCAALGIDVGGIRRRRGRRLAGVRWVGGPGDLTRLAARSDVLVIAVPHTTETVGMVNADVLTALPNGAFVINLARGALLDEEALLAQLEAGRLAGCVLDVFAVEPLPPAHPFWRHPRVLVTPHVSAASSGFWARETALILENVRRFRAGRPLKNVVDPQAGY